VRTVRVKKIKGFERDQPLRKRSCFEYGCRHCGKTRVRSTLADLMCHEENCHTWHKPANGQSSRSLLSLDDDTILYILGGAECHALSLDTDPTKARTYIALFTSCLRLSHMRIPVKLKLTHFRARPVFGTERCRYHFADLTLQGDAFQDQDIDSIIEAQGERLHTLTLDCCRQVTSLQALKQCKLLRSLTLSQCTRITEITPLAHCKRLSSLRMTSLLRLRDVSPLAHCPSLHTLSVNECVRLMDVSPLSLCGSLTSLALDGCHNVTSEGVAQLVQCPALRSLDLTHCDSVTSLPRVLLGTPSHQPCDKLDALMSVLQHSTTLRIVTHPNGLRTDLSAALGAVTRA